MIKEYGDVNATGTYTTSGTVIKLDVENLLGIDSDIEGAEDSQFLADLMDMVEEASEC